MSSEVADTKNNDSATAENENNQVKILTSLMFLKAYLKRLS